VDADLRDEFDYHLLGYTVPPMIGPCVPVFTGIPRDVSQEALMNLGAQLNTAGAYSMYHVVGVTPEAPTLEAALGGRGAEMSVTVTDADLARQRDELSEPAEVIDFVLVGCPHLTLEQVRRMAQALDGRRLKAELWICTSFATRELLQRMGLLALIEAAGGHVVSDTCIDEPCWHHLAGRSGMTDSPKCMYYTRMRGMHFTLGRLSECVEAAVSGKAS
jgi:predicted aconitase